MKYIGPLIYALLQGSFLPLFLPTDPSIPSPSKDNILPFSTSALESSAVLRKESFRRQALREPTRLSQSSERVEGERQECIRMRLRLSADYIVSRFEEWPNFSSRVGLRSGPTSHSPVLKIKEMSESAPVLFHDGGHE